MAACDNLYGNAKQWQELYEFLSQTHPEWIDLYMHDRPEGEQECRICYVAEIQEFMNENCPLPWVKDKLNENFDVQRMILGRAHHEEKMKSGYRVEYDGDHRICIIPDSYIPTYDLIEIIKVYNKLGFNTWLPADERRGLIFERNMK